VVSAAAAAVPAAKSASAPAATTDVILVRSFHFYSLSVYILMNAAALG
jgi:hypothetical protein